MMVQQINNQTNQADGDDAIFAGLTVLDLSQGIAGPYCGQILRQQGARVIKVEPPQGDWSRTMGRSREGLNALAIAYNTGKESVVLDTRSEAGRRALFELASHADVVLQNYRPGVVSRMGVDYDSLRQARPDLVYLSISGYGADGPSSALPALDTVMQAVTGMMHVNRDAAGKPRRVGFFVIDLATGLYAAQTVAAALYRSARTGKGRHIELSMLQTCAALQAYVLLEDALFPGDASSVFTAPSGLFDTADGAAYVSMVNDAMFLRLCTLMHRPDWAADTSLHTSAGRAQRASEINTAVADMLVTQPNAHWEALFVQHDVLFGVAAEPPAMRHHPQAIHAGIFTDMELPGVGALPWTGMPGMGRKQPPPGKTPRLGEHTADILKEFGIALD